MFRYQGERISWRDLDILIRGEWIEYICPQIIALPLNVVNEIVPYITCGKTFKRILLSCRYLYEKYKASIPKYCNHLLILMKKKKIKWEYIYANPNIQSKHIDQFIKEIIGGKKLLGFQEVTKNPNLTINQDKE